MPEYRHSQPVRPSIEPIPRSHFVRPSIEAMMGGVSRSAPYADQGALHPANPVRPHRPGSGSAFRGPMPSRRPDFPRLNDPGPQSVATRSNAPAPESKQPRIQDGPVSRGDAGVSEPVSRHVGGLMSMPRNEATMSRDLPDNDHATEESKGYFAARADKLLDSSS
jgi:hypothetical protein